MKILLIILSILILYPTKPTFTIYASQRYARIENQTNIYKIHSSIENIQNTICIAEKSYFVEIVSEYEDKYRVNYNGISGYVKKNDVREITGNPITPYPYNIKLQLASDCNFRSSPFINTEVSNIITTLKAGETNFTFIGRIFSEEAIDFGGTTWYYVNYQGTNGYIYNKYVKSITPIYENKENVNYKSNNSTELINPITHTPSIIIIIILFLPCIAILLILYLPRKHTFKTKPKKVKSEKERY